jgi:hypothetical protein
VRTAIEMGEYYARGEVRSDQIPEEENGGFPEEEKGASLEGGLMM